MTGRHKRITKSFGHVVPIMVLSGLPRQTLPGRPAQGGGRNFKDRKPIREVGCCDARVAEKTR